MCKELIDGFISVIQALFTSSSSIDFDLGDTFLEETDIDSLLTGDRSSKLLLDYYTPQNIIEKISSFGLTKKLGQLGYNNVRCILDTSDPFVNRCIITDDKLLNLGFGGFVDEAIKEAALRDVLTAELEHDTSNYTVSRSDQMHFVYQPAPTRNSDLPEQKEFNYATESELNAQADALHFPVSHQHTPENADVQSRESSPIDYSRLSARPSPEIPNLPNRVSRFRFSSQHSTTDVNRPSQSPASLFTQLVRRWNETVESEEYFRIIQQRSRFVLSSFMWIFPTIETNPPQSLQLRETRNILRQKQRKMVKGDVSEISLEPLTKITESICGIKISGEWSNLIELLFEEEKNSLHRRIDEEKAKHYPPFNSLSIDTRDRSSHLHHATITRQLSPPAANSTEPESCESVSPQMAASFTNHNMFGLSSPSPSNSVASLESYGPFRDFYRLYEQERDPTSYDRSLSRQQQEFRQYFPKSGASDRKSELSYLIDMQMRKAMMTVDDLHFVVKHRREQTETAQRNVEAKDVRVIDSDSTTHNPNRLNMLPSLDHLTNVHSIIPDDLLRFLQIGIFIFLAIFIATTDPVQAVLGFISTNVRNLIQNHIQMPVVVIFSIFTLSSFLFIIWLCCSSSPTTSVDHSFNTVISNFIHTNSHPTRKHSHPLLKPPYNTRTGMEQTIQLFSSFFPEDTPMNCFTIEWLHNQNPMDSFNTDVLSETDFSDLIEEMASSEKLQKGYNVSSSFTASETPNPFNSKHRKDNAKQDPNKIPQRTARQLHRHSQKPAERQKLPGQRCPGLGIGFALSRVFVSMANDLKADGIVNCPEHFHNAYLYRKYFRFINPMHQAFFVTLLTDLNDCIEEFGLASVGYCVSMGAVVDKYVLMDGSPNNGQPLVDCATVVWKKEEMVQPRSPRMIKYFDSKEYRRIYLEHLKFLKPQEGQRFFVCWEKILS
ncbi:hypothetical protein BLNAU_2820 [Blattamonas nauphoetae]|uniref:Uncharacterized protein n=1 Tax=Blattamonas nauphoetae TaxID=2049346 RepID=A0ABQ9YEM5_9EUKA|nr:hypothetical protein BLNAU_2820 [Blattamonas nauphoetae]